MTAITFDRKPLAVFMVERITFRRPAPTITAPCATVARQYTALDELNRQAYVAQSAATSGGRVAQFRRL
jgi:hypothetical protein